MSWAAMKSASLTSAGCAGLREITHPSGRFHRCTLLCPRLTSARSVRSRSVRCRFHTCRPVYRGLDKIVVTVPSVHPAPVRCRFRPGSADDGQGTPASFSARAIRATEWPASRRAKIHRTGAAAQRTIRAAAGSRRAGQAGVPAQLAAAYLDRPGPARVAGRGHAWSLGPLGHQRRPRLGTLRDEPEAGHGSRRAIGGIRRSACDGAGGLGITVDTEQRPSVRDGRTS